MNVDKDNVEKPPSLLTTSQSITTETTTETTTTNQRTNGNENCNNSNQSNGGRRDDGGATAESSSVSPEVRIIYDHYLLVVYLIRIVSILIFCYAINLSRSLARSLTQTNLNRKQTISIPVQ